MNCQNREKYRILTTFCLKSAHFFVIIKEKRKNCQFFGQNLEKTAETREFANEFWQENAETRKFANRFCQELKNIRSLTVLTMQTDTQRSLNACLQDDPALKPECLLARRSSAEV